MYATFGENVDPGVFSGGVESGGGEGVGSVGGVCEGAGCKWIGSFEGIRGRGIGCRRSCEWLGREKADCLCYCRLKKATVDGMVAAVGREDLADVEECSEGCILETDIITPQTPSMVRRIKGVFIR